MIWLTWRQFRIQALTALVILVAAAIYLFITGLQLRHSYTADLRLCQGKNDCDAVFGQLEQHYESTLDFAEIVVVIAPALLGIFWGAPLVARELETGTHRLSWTQSVSRTQWLAVRLIGVGLAAMLVAGLLSLLLTWWASPLDLLEGGRFTIREFDTHDIAPLGYAAFAFTLGTTAGLLIHRTIPAMAVTLAIFIAVQIFVPAKIRPILLTPTVTSVALNQATMSRATTLEATGSGNISASDPVYVYGLPVPTGSWVESSTSMENSAGTPIGMGLVQNCMNSPSAAGFGQIGACLVPFDLHVDITYEPSTDYWPLQWYETGIFLALSGLLTASCFWWIRRRQD